MKRIVSISLALITTLSAAVLHADTKLKHPWVDRDYVLNADPFKSILVIGVPDHPDKRRSLEDGLVKSLEKAGVKATASLDIMSADTEVNRDTVVAALAGKDVDAVFLTSLARVDDVEIVKGGSYSNTAYYDAQSTAALYDALDQITASLITCDLPLSVPPLSPDDIFVTVDGSSYDQITAADCANDVDGWYYSIQYTQLTLCGNACDTFKALATPAAHVEYYCTGGG